ncbi:hypothetical protein FB451DRAFT_1188094 [Mycena latifolia]|nr:hypothetical protein FB451DRAFT_1188094 [Mycena latifolia]
MRGPHQKAIRGISPPPTSLPTARERANVSCVRSAPPTASANSQIDTLDRTNAQPTTQPQPDTPPRKAAKRTREDSQRRSDPPSERISPDKRYQAKPRFAHPLANPFQVPRHRNTSPTPTPSRAPSLVDYASDLDDDARWDNLPFFQPDNDPPALSATASTSSQSDAAPSPAESAPSPAASAPSPSTTVTSPAASAQSPPNSPSCTARSLSPSPSLTEVLPAEDIVMDDAPPASTPRTRAQWLAAGPDCHNENPHRPSLLHDAGNDEAATQYAGFQGNNPLWNLPVIPDHVALDNVDDATKAAIEENPGNYLAATVFCGGSTLSNRYTNLRPDTQKTMEEVTGEGVVRVIKPQAKTTSKAPRRGGGKPDKFAPPATLIVRCSDAGARTALARQATFGRDRALAFHITLFSAACLSWAVGFFRTDINDPPALTGRCLAFAVYDGLKNGIRGAPKALALIDRATQGGSSSSLDQRLLSFARTFEVRYLAHDDNPIYVLFAKPCTTDHKLWDAVRAAMRAVTYIDEIEAFTPHANASSGHNICADCKLDCHPKYLCMFTVCDRNWWGPHDLAGALRDIRGGGDTDEEDEGTLRGAPRGRGWRGGFRAGGRGRG